MSTVNFVDEPGSG